MISALNDCADATRDRAGGRARSLAGGWCWLALGSEGRMEQTLVTDQDNALIYRAAKREHSSPSPTR